MNNNKKKIYIAHSEIDTHIQMQLLVIQQGAAWFIKG